MLSPKLRVWTVTTARALAALAALAVLGCGGALPRPTFTQVVASDYIAVPFGPRPAPVEVIPPSPAKDAVWVDGSWEWAGTRYGWRFGSWVVVPGDLRRARWKIVRRKEDGQLFFAPSSWKNTAGEVVEERALGGGLGPAARARARIGAPPPLPDRAGGRAGSQGRVPAGLWVDEEEEEEEE